MKRGYNVTGRDRNWAVPVVAHTACEAKTLAWKTFEWELDCDWIDLRVIWLGGATVDDLPFGVVEDDMAAYQNKLTDYVRG